ncbi:high nitrogen upregulated cytochrome P450 monooxygenase 2 [Sanghuangporus baumii]|uniref:High nitrogen upregulated cytochrome P450 monooxygenase 2 n=1 Tax=Sanghuangporus baumii TaxID=108892 RepID=A0A9Q5HV03_SANBA|nr:high nitrogen upregulated cytochrome P450 monooxygenase 2 [Sanghuangporus baumii]
MDSFTKVPSESLPLPMDLLSPHVIGIPQLAFHDAVLLDVACALAVHAIYRRYEPDTSLPFVQIILLIATPSLPAAVFLRHFETSRGLAVLTAFALFYVTLIASIVFYRLSPWHPLAKYPGPLLAKISKAWASYHTAKGKLHLDLKKLHEKYGRYVRIGPNELSVADASVISSALSDGMPKGPMWKARTSPSTAPTLIAIRSSQEHARRRKRWNRAFNSSAVKGYEQVVQKRALQLVSELEKRSVKNGNQSVNLAEWISFFATDFMGDMAFGGGFELMRDGGDKEGVWTVLESGMRTAAIVHHVPWIMPLLRKLPFVSRDLLRFRRFGIGRAEARKVNGSLTRDLFYHLIDEDNVEKVAPTDSEIVSDGSLAIIAGSDTTSTTLSGLIYYLMSHPLDYRRLQNEIDYAFPPGEGDPFDTLKLSEMPFLNAVINEAMRLQPPVPTYLQRSPEAGTGGKWIGDSYISEGTAVIVPPYILFRDPAYFSPAPNNFWPDRWLPHDAVKRYPYQSDFEADALSNNYDGEIVTNSSAFIPFSYGPANCAGRALALTEMRMVVALLMQKFELQFAPGYDPNDWEEHLEDFFVLCNGPLLVTLTPRM